MGITEAQMQLMELGQKYPALHARCKKLEALAELADSVLEDVLPQVGQLALQDYGALNELCLAITEYKRVRNVTDSN